MGGRLLALALAGASLAAFCAFRQGFSPPAGTAVPAPVLIPGQRFTDDALGTIGDVVVDPHGRLFALDVQRQGLVVHSGPGTRRVMIGRRGRGPGEFVAAISLALDSSGRLLVLDPGTRRIEVFRTDEGVPRRVGALPLSFPAEDLAACGGRLFLLGSWRFNLIHEISAADGRVLRSFAPDSVAEDDLMAGYRSSGYLECGPGASLTFLPMLRPELTRFSLATGARIGRLTIPGYAPVRVTRTLDGGLMFRAPASGVHDMASSLVTLPGGSQLVQVGVLEEGARTRHEFREIRSFTVSWDAPSIRPRGSGLPRILRAAGDSVFVVETNPAPRVTAARIRL